ncbi:MAG: NAD(P)H-dependent glycerol-3-phosphate dehydrogenase [Bacillota bacterium]
MTRITILGAGSWGTALAVHLARKGLPVTLWARRPDYAAELSLSRENKAYLPGVKIPLSIEISADWKALLAGAECVVFAVPSHAFREVLVMVSRHLDDVPCVNVAKGIEADSLLRLSQVYKAVTGDKNLSRYASLSGPSHAEEVGRAMPTALVAASPCKPVAEFVQDLFISPELRVYTNPDLIGVELGGALKNIIAVATGISDGLGYGDNTKAALMTRGLAEITRLGVHMGADPLTFGGLTGVGDLIVTCTSMHSRNRRFGIEIGKGRTLKEALGAVRMVVEGVRTTIAATELSRRLNVEMPITRQVYAVLYEGVSPLEGVTRLMTRQRTREIEEVARIKVTWRHED